VPEQPLGIRDFAAISQELMADSQEVATLKAVVDRAVDVVPGCDWASVTVRRRGQRLETLASSSQFPEDCDQLQYELGEGPCADAVWDADSYLSQDIGADPRWPRWGPRVAELGIGSVLAIRLTTEQETIGALNLYSATRDAYDEDALDHATVFTAHAANALGSARLVSGLETAMMSRHQIGIAQGILVATYGLTVDQAFDVLRRYSSHRNVKLRHVAEQVVRAGGIPDEKAGPAGGPGASASA
jgi:GAF domain-containing protein